ncbi:MAG: hypothetical protein V1702_06745 [Candidatus Woesearchaeota archaeon]
MFRVRGKKGIEAWISWVLIIGFSIAVGALVMRFMTGFATGTVEEMIERDNQQKLCDSAAISVKAICQNTQVLNINVSNNGNLRIEELLFRMYDIYTVPQVTYKNQTINTEKTLRVAVVKQGVISQVEVMPVVQEGKKRYICQNKKVTKSEVAFC